LSDLTDQIRKGLGKKQAKLKLNTPEDYKSILVTISDPPGKHGVLNVRARIPVFKLGYTDTDIETLMSDMEDPTLAAQVETEVQLVSGIKFLSDWTASSIKVSMPGFINDFAGDTDSETDTQ